MHSTFRTSLAQPGSVGVAHDYHLRSCGSCGSFSTSTCRHNESEGDSGSQKHIGKLSLTFLKRSWVINAP